MLDLVKGVVVFLCLFVLLKAFVVEGYPVHGPSMVPTLEEGDRILVFKLPVRLQRVPFLRGVGALDPGDLVVFDSPGEVNQRYVKRVVAAGPAGRNRHVARAASSEPAVFVRYEDGFVYINNQLVDETVYLSGGAGRAPGLHRATLGPGELYVLGDHRSVSKDSRRFGPVPLDHVVGRAVLRFWPPHKFGLL